MYRSLDQYLAERRMIPYNTRLKIIIHSFGWISNLFFFFWTAGGECRRRAIYCVSYGELFRRDHTLKKEAHSFFVVWEALWF